MPSCTDDGGMVADLLSGGQQRISVLSDCSSDRPEQVQYLGNLPGSAEPSQLEVGHGELAAVGSAVGILLQALGPRRTADLQQDGGSLMLLS